MTSKLGQACEDLCVGEIQEIILEMLDSTDVDHRITRKELVDKLHLTDRKVRDEINAMRSNGIPVASTMTKAGYYLPATMFEYLDFARHYRGRAASIFATERKMKETAFIIFCGQVKIGDDVDG